MAWHVESNRMVLRVLHVLHSQLTQEHMISQPSIPVPVQWRQVVLLD